MTTVYLINRIPSRTLAGKSPFELVFKKHPTLDHLRVFGCLCYATNLKKQHKFSPRGVPSVFLGYYLVQKGYKLYDLQNHSLFVTRDVIFKENVFPFQQQMSSSIKFANSPILQQHFIDYTHDQDPVANHFLAADHFSTDHDTTVDQHLPDEPFTPIV